MDGIDLNFLQYTLQRRLMGLTLLIFFTGCGADDGAGSAHTVNGSFWTSFAASVTERYPEPIIDDTSEGVTTTQEATDRWSVDADGYAQYSSNQAALASPTGNRQPKIVAAHELEEGVLTTLKNTLSQSRILTWEDQYTCSMVRCTGDHGMAILHVNLNGTDKTVAWPIAAEGLPDGLELVVQYIKDVSG